MTIYQVDSFTNEIFKGNPAAVCITEEPLDKKLQQQIALEMNLSETAFVTPLSEDSFSIRFFTPTTEVDLCGHATLASGHILFELGIVTLENTINFHSNVGELLVTCADTWINMNFPASTLTEVEIPEGLESALGVTVKKVLIGNQWKVVVLENEEAVRAANSEPGPLMTIDCGHITITAQSSTGPADYINRVFAPLYGIPEDPVTGSAQTVLTPYWDPILNKDSYTCHQLSARGGVLKTEMLEKGRVLVSGQGVTVMRAELYI